MNWTDARKRLMRLAKGRESTEPLRGLGARPGNAFGPGVARPGFRTPRPTRASTRYAAHERLGRSVRAASLCVASGKGGTGKSVISSSIAALLARRGRTLIFDADFGVGNAHIFQDVSPPKTIAQVVEGSDSVRDVVVPCSGQLDLVAAGSGVPRLANLSEHEMHLLSTGIEDLEFDYKYLVVDSAAGVSRQTVSFAGSSDLTLIVTTPDLTAMTDAYAFFKVLMARTGRRPLLVVNRAQSANEADEVSQRILKVCDRFLGITPIPIGFVPDDPNVPRCVNQRSTVVLREPDCPASLALEQVAVEVLEHLGREHPAGMGRQLASAIGYAS